MLEIINEATIGYQMNLKNLSVIDCSLRNSKVIYTNAIFDQVSIRDISSKKNLFVESIILSFDSSKLIAENIDFG